jgi:spore coat protein U-like protein
MDKYSRFTSNSVKLAVMALAICGAGNAMAATANATSTSVVVTPIQISKTVDLSFGSIASGGTTGTVTLTPGGTRTVGGGAVAVGGVPAAAKFDVTGQSGLTYAITMTGTSANLTSGTDTIPFTVISDVTASAITTGIATSGTLTGGAQSIYVGGSLAVGANQPAGTYTGTVAVAVDYN